MSARCSARIGGFLLCFAAARNLARSHVGAHSSSRRFLEFCRTVPEIVFALIFVVAFGLGPLPGVLALAIHTMGALGKLFSEVVENIDMKPVEGVTATGARLGPDGPLRGACRRCCRTSPATRLLRFEINVRGAAVMGFVGAGGIGQDLHRGDPQVLLLRRQRHPGADHRHGDRASTSSPSASATP